LKIIFYFFNL